MIRVFACLEGQDSSIRKLADRAWLVAAGFTPASVFATPVFALGPDFEIPNTLLNSDVTVAGQRRMPYESIIDPRDFLSKAVE